MNAKPSAQRRKKMNSKLLSKRQGPLVTQHSMLNITWDSSKTLKENYKRLGLVSDVNADGKRIISREKAKLMGIEAIQDSLQDSKDGELKASLEAIKGLPPAAPRLQTTMAVWEQVELKNLIEKYGEDTEKMSRDIKLNKLQRNPSQLEKRIQLLQRLQAL